MLQFCQLMIMGILGRGITVLSANDRHFNQSEDGTTHQSCRGWWRRRRPSAGRWSHQTQSGTCRRDAGEPSASPAARSLCDSPLPQLYSQAKRKSNKPKISNTINNVEYIFLVFGFINLRTWKKHTFLIETRNLKLLQQESWITDSYSTHAWWTIWSMHHTYHKLKRLRLCEMELYWWEWAHDEWWEDEDSHSLAD